MMTINHLNSAAVQAPATQTPKGHKLLRDAKAAAVAAIGPHARDTYEYLTWKSDGLYYWRETDEVRPDTEAEVKANGGKRKMAKAMPQTAPAEAAHASETGEA